MRIVVAFMVVLGSLTVAGSAWGQATMVTPFGIREIPTATTDELVIGPADCGTSRQLFWLWNQFGIQPCNQMRIWATQPTSDGGQATCGNEPKSGDFEYDPVNALLLTSVRSGSFTINIDDLPGFGAGSATPCGGETTKNIEHRICAAVPTSINCFGIGTAPQTTTASPLRILYDVEPPRAPVISEVKELDKGLRIVFSVSSDTASVVPFVREKDGTADFTRRANQTVGSVQEVIIDGLVNGRTYVVKLRAVDGAGNESFDSEEREGAPRRTVGFWGSYREAGGNETGGCRSLPHLMPLAALIGFLRRRRS